MSIVLSIVLASLALLVAMYLATNLVGMVVRGFFRDVRLEEMKQDKNTHEFIKKEIAKDNKADNATTVVFIAVSVGVFYLLYQYTNLWVLSGVVLLMLNRIPDLIWEIKTGKKVTRSNRPTGGIYTLTDVTILLTFPILWWGLFIWLRAQY
ncbi:MAG: hypothetical protein WD061_02075 [Candidatus Saccharimonadales bacterium]